MGGYYYVNDPDSALGYFPVPEEEYIEAIFRIAQKRGVKITDKIILEELEEMRKEEKAKTKRKARKNEKVLLFRVILENDRQIWREVEILDQQTLYELAEFVVGAFGFNFDHCFGFYSNWKGSLFNSEEMYELFTDLPDVEHTPQAKGVERVPIAQTFPHEGKTMLFLFDYGDDWRFIVNLKKIKSANKKLYPRLVKKKGIPPEQYPEIEEHDEMVS